LAAKHKAKPSGYVEESLFSTRRIAPTKADYIKKLAGVITETDISSLNKQQPATKEKPAAKKPSTKAKPEKKPAAKKTVAKRPVAKAKPAKTARK
jgi:hypothetical protein